MGEVQLLTGTYSQVWKVTKMSKVSYYITSSLHLLQTSDFPNMSQYLECKNILSSIFPNIFNGQLEAWPTLAVDQGLYPRQARHHPQPLVLAKEQHRVSLSLSLFFSFGLL